MSQEYHLFRIIVVVRSTKEIKSRQKFVRTRNYTNFSIQQLRENILNHPQYIQVNYEPDPNIVATTIQTIIQNSIDNIAPIKHVQIKPRTNQILSEVAKNVLADRDIARIQFKNTNNSEDLRNYKNLKNEANIIVSREKYLRNLKKIKNNMKVSQLDGKQ